MTAVAAATAARFLTRVIVLVGLLSAAITPPAQPAAGEVFSGGEQPVVRAEVRLRKLHLVRPDLIPYPIAYEVVC